MFVTVNFGFMPTTLFKKKNYGESIFHAKCYFNFILREGGIFSRYNGTASNLTARKFPVHWRLLDDKIEQELIRTKKIQHT